MKLINYQSDLFAGDNPVAMDDSTIVGEAVPLGPLDLTPELREAYANGKVSRVLEFRGSNGASGFRLWLRLNGDTATAFLVKPYATKEDA